MTTRKSTRRNEAADAELLGSLRAAAQQIWLAGLNALVRTQEEGGKVLGALKSEGRRGQRAAQRGFSGLGDEAGRAAIQATRGASAAFEHLEQLLEAGMGRALERLGVPTAKDMQAVLARLDALEGRAAQPARKPARGARSTAHSPARRRPAAKPKTVAKRRGTRGRAAV